MTLEEMMVKILDNSCSNPLQLENGKYTGWNQYYIETHCTAWKIIAKKSSGNWVIREATPEDC